MDLKSELFTYDIDQQAQRRAEVMDGKLMLVTNVADLSAEQIVARYKRRQRCVDGGFSGQQPVGDLGRQALNAFCRSALTSRQPSIPPGLTAAVILGTVVPIAPLHSPLRSISATAMPRRPASSCASVVQ